ncbi:hypothetical protein CPB86DRAFT_791344 [Serendipita vermifera]|nr:hypothetical protein CPB86DRAFT_791344 [Serendipita vermifera]
MAIRLNNKLVGDPDWLQTVRELRRSLYDWCTLGYVESLLQCDTIASKLATLHVMVLAFDKEYADVHDVLHRIISDPDSLIPTVWEMYQRQGTLDSLEKLSVAHQQTVITLLNRVIDFLPPSSSTFRSLIDFTISKLELLSGKTTTETLVATGGAGKEGTFGPHPSKKAAEVKEYADIPNLTGLVELVQSEPVLTESLGDVYIGRFIDHIADAGPGGRRKDEGPMGFLEEGGQVTLRAVKLLRTGDERTRKAIVQDLRTRLTLHHQYLLPFLGLSLDLGNPNGSNATTPTSTYTPYSSSINGPFIISPYLANGSASYYLQLHPHANSLSILLGAAKGLSFLHSLLPQIVHGDVRGANILVDSSGEAVLADYGLFRLMNGGRGNARTTSQFSTLGGGSGFGSAINGGTTSGGGMRSIKDVINVEGVRWAAPEIVCDQRHLEALIAQSNRMDGRTWNGRWGPERQVYGGSDDFLEIVTVMSDIWSFGMTMYELLTGRLPYYQHVRDETVALAISLQELPKPPSSVSEVRPEWTPELWSLMQECWMIDRRRRPNVDELIRRLTSIVNQGLNVHDMSKPPRPTVTTSTTAMSNETSPVKKGSPMLQVPSGSPNHLPNTEASSSRHSLHGRHEQRTHGILKHHASAETLSYQKSSRASRNPEWFVALRHSNSASALRHQMSIQSFHEPHRVTIVRPQRNNSVLSNGTSPTVSPRCDKFPTTVRMDLLRSAELEVTLPPGMYIKPEPGAPTAASSYGLVDTASGQGAVPKDSRDVGGNGMRADLPQDAVQRDSLIDLNTEEDAEPAASSENRSRSPSAMPFGKKWSAMTVTERRILLRECQLERQYGPTDDLSDHDWVTRLSAHGITLEALELRAQLGGVQIGLSNPRSGSVFSPSRSMSSASRSQSHGATSPSSTSRASPYPVNMSSPISRASPHPGPSTSNRSIASPVMVHPTLSPASGASSPVGMKFQPSPISPFSPCGLPYSSKEFMSSSWDVPAGMTDARSRSIFMEERDRSETMHSSSHGHDASSEYSPSQSHTHFWSSTSTDNRNRGFSVSKNTSTPQPGPSQTQQTRTRSPDLLPPPIWQNPSLQLKKKPVISITVPHPEKSLKSNAPHVKAGPRSPIALGDTNFPPRSSSIAAHQQSAYVQTVNVPSILTTPNSDDTPRKHVSTPMSVDVDSPDQTTEGSQSPDRTFSIERSNTVLSNHTAKGRVNGNDVQISTSGNHSPQPLHSPPHSPQSPLDIVKEAFSSVQIASSVPPEMDNMVGSSDIHVLSPSSSHNENHRVNGLGVTMGGRRASHHPNPQIQHLKNLLQWEQYERKIVAIDDPNRRVRHSGVLYHCADPEGSRQSIEDKNTSVEVYAVLLDNAFVIADPPKKGTSIPSRIRAVFLLADIYVPDAEMARYSRQQVFLLDSPTGKKIASPIQLRYRSNEQTVAEDKALATPDSPFNSPIQSALSPFDPQRPRALSTSSALGIGLDRAVESLFPQELILLAATKVEADIWREKLGTVKIKAEATLTSAHPNKSMFRLNPLAHVPFMPSSSGVFHVKGRRYILLCSDDADGGAVIRDDTGTLQPLMAPAQVKQCFILSSMRLALLLVGKSLWSLKLSELTGPDMATPTVIKNGVNFFHIGYHKGVLLLVLVSELSKSTQLKWYTCATRPSRPTSGFFGRNSKLFKQLGEHELPGRLHGVEVLDNGIIAFGESGFQLLSIDQGTKIKPQELPRIPLGASSQAAQQCQTSKPVAVTRSGDDFLLCYADFGVYVNPTGEIIGRTIEWTSSKISSISFAGPYLFLVSDSSIEVRLIENGRKVEMIEGRSMRLLRGMDEVRLSSSKGQELAVETTAASDETDGEDDTGILHFATRPDDSPIDIAVMELEMDILDLSA